MDEESPCIDCGRDCDGWEMNFCCIFCMWAFENDPPCETCDPMDL